MILSMTCRRNLFPVFFLLVVGGYFLFRSFPESQEYANIVVPAVEEFEVVEPVQKETFIEPAQEATTVIEPVQEETTIIENDQEEIPVIEPVQEKTRVIEPVNEELAVIEPGARVFGDDKSSEIMDPVEEINKNTHSQHRKTG
eukprot:TRINITY_DN29687_c0_g1_i1.p1 TRINITY_DN29687_c0_g1~~TRINITY_DN29687_c0_g1_i1.p1  ORF type:complete len:159 (-),score=38.48 TRINITY_DN29687_c0_g1_i1:48-476(-)